ncbi:Vir protein [Legionella sp.]|uniref:Vir protein n=1 Tax=Legionella sp. TaxID=459 RepID=UPI000CB94EFB|nr:Vir protein [Legionella sp.]PJE14679.1 MAG: Vir protein [Legionella sp.]
MFVRFGAIYGHIWWSIYKNEVLLEVTKKEWSESLQRFDTRTLKTALLRCREEKAYPPTLPQFIECCKDIHTRSEPCSKHESIQPARAEVAERHLKEMFRILNA